MGVMTISPGVVPAAIKVIASNDRLLKYKGTDTTELKWTNPRPTAWPMPKNMTTTIIAGANEDTRSANAQHSPPNSIPFCPPNWSHSLPTIGPNRPIALPREPGIAEINGKNPRLIFDVFYVNKGPWTSSSPKTSIEPFMYKSFSYVINNS